MPTTVDCPSCGRVLLLPDDVATAAVRCPGCASTFPGSVASAVTEPEALPRVRSLQAVETPARGSDQRACPYCREAIPGNATFCRFCGEELAAENDNVPPWERVGALRRDVDSHRGGLVLTLGVAGMIASGIHVLSVIGVPLSVTAWVMGQSDLKRMRANQLDPGGAGLTQAGRICGIIGTCLGLLWWLLGLLLLSLRF
jgi:hypothetical protein